MTGSPEMLGGRVKTLHPKIHGGILADRSKPEHLRRPGGQRDRGDRPGRVATSTRSRRTPPSSSSTSAGPTMVRAAAKNHEHVGWSTSPADYPVVLEELRASGSLSAATRRRLARAAFAHTAAYDAAIVAWLDAGGPARSASSTGHRGRRRGGRLSASCRRPCTSPSSAPRCCATARTPTSAARATAPPARQLVGRHGPARRQGAVVPQPLRR